MCDASGFGEGQTFLGFATPTTNGSGDAPLDVTLPVAVAGGQFITATATDPANNTSEFSACVQLPGAPPSFALTVTTTGSGTVTSSPAGIDCAADCAEFYNSGTVVTLTATPAAGSVFAGFGGHPDCSDGSVTMDSDKACTATFNLLPAPDDDGDGVPNNADQCPGTPAGQPVNASGCAQSQLDDDGDGVSNSADQCPGTLAGQPVNANGCAASQLDDDSDGVPNPTDRCPATSAGQLVNANGCAASQLLYTVTPAGAGSGTVTSTPAGIDCGADCVEVYAPGTIVTLVPVAAAGSSFGGWSGACTGTGLCILIVSADLAVTATFEPVANPATRPRFTAPANGLQLTLGTPMDLTFTWTAVTGAVQYGFEFTGPDRKFANRNGNGPDPVHGFGGAGGAFLVPITSLTVRLVPGLPDGVYESSVCFRSW